MAEEHPRKTSAHSDDVEKTEHTATAIAIASADDMEPSGGPTVDKRRFWTWRRGPRAMKPQFTHPLGSEKTSPETLVDFDGPDDPYRPTNWPSRKKFATIILYGITALGTSFNSAIFASATETISEHFDISTTVSSLATSVTLMGFAVGPLLWGPLSEVYGRKWVILVPYFLSGCFAFGCGASAHLQGILITRFFQGVFSGSVITNTGGVMGDIYPPKERGLALIIYTTAVVGGPLTAPLIGSAIIADPHLGWRWIMYVVGMLQLFTSILGMILLDESYAPVLLVYKAKQLRLETGNWAIHAKHEEWNMSFQEVARKYLVRPFKLLLNPICFLMAFYASFIYGLIYGSLFAIPIIFEKSRGWTPVLASLPFFGMLAGAVLGLSGNYLNQKPYGRAVDANGGRAVPEARLYPMMLGGFFMTGGLFLLAWTGESDVIWVVPCIGVFFIGAGFFPIFQAALNFIIDTFLPVAASAIAAMTFMRSTFAASFSLFMGPLLNTLGIRWGLSLLGFIGIVLLPVPYFFYVFGSRLRAYSERSMTWV